MFEGQNLGQGLLYVIEWPLVTSNLDPSECFTNPCKVDTQGFHFSGHSSNSIKNWPLQIKLYLPYPQICAAFWKPTSSINHWIATLLLVVWTSTLIFMMPQMTLYSDQVRNRVALSGMQMTPGSRSKSVCQVQHQCSIISSCKVTFSQAGHTLTPRRNKLSGKSFETHLLFKKTRRWHSDNISYFLWSWLTLVMMMSLLIGNLVLLCDSWHFYVCT